MTAQLIILPGKANVVADDLSRNPIIDKLQVRGWKLLEDLSHWKPRRKEHCINMIMASTLVQLELLRRIEEQQDSDEENKKLKQKVVDGESSWVLDKDILK